MSEIELIRACKLWDKITEKMNNGDYPMPEALEHTGSNRPYSSGDFSPLKCRIDGQKAELTVGSAEGHRVHVDLEEKKLEYYDTDEGPNQVMKDLLEDAGLKCEVEHDGVFCKGLKKENVQEVFKVLAMPTSMDYRLDYCRKEQADPEEECREQCQEQEPSIPDDLDFSCVRGCVEEQTDECVSDCVDNYEYPEEEGDCQDLEKQFFTDGPKKETLTKTEATIHPPSQVKLKAWTT
jgi:hypothetical protein